MLQIRPGNVLGLISERRDIGESRPRLLAQERTLDQLIDGKNGLAHSTVAHSHHEAVAIQRRMKLALLRPRAVVDRHSLDGRSCHSITSFLSPSAPPMFNGSNLG